jgi:catechol 2,3-dioxygenase-like lactoylglutathione lyase family enzyme
MRRGSRVATTTSKEEPVGATVTGVHHLKIWVTDLARSRQFYERVFGLEHRTSFADDNGVVRGMAFLLPGTSVQVAIRQDAGLAAALAGADPFALATTRAGLDEWVAHLDALGVPHSPIITASSGYGMGFLDPDGIQIRLYAEDDTVRAERVDAGGIAHAGSIPRIATPEDLQRFNDSTG